MKVGNLRIQTLSSEVQMANKIADPISYTFLVTYRGLDQIFYSRCNFKVYLVTPRSPLSLGKTEVILKIHVEVSTFTCSNPGERDWLITPWYCIFLWWKQASDLWHPQMIMVGVVRLKYFPSNENISLRPALNSGTMGSIPLSDLLQWECPEMSVPTERMEEGMLSNLPSSLQTWKQERLWLCRNVYVAHYRRKKGNWQIMRHDSASRSPCKVPSRWPTWVSLGGG